MSTFTESFRSFDGPVFDPYAHYELMRESSPIRYDEEANAWLVYRYTTIEEMVRDPATFSSRASKSWKSETLVQMDDPDHAKIRRLVARAFTPRLVSDLAPKMGLAGDVARGR
jgi:cytochrome P450 family 109